VVSQPGETVSHQTLHSKGSFLLFPFLFLPSSESGEGLNSALRKSSCETQGPQDPALSTRCRGLPPRPAGGIAGHTLARGMPRYSPTRSTRVPWVQGHPNIRGSHCQVLLQRYTPQGAVHIRPRCPFPFFLPSFPSSSLILSHA
jgi:hypothetical protein